MDPIIKLNEKINRNNRQRRRGLRSLKYKKRRGVIYTDKLPKLSETHAVAAVDTLNQKFYINDGEYWVNTNTVSIIILPTNGNYVIPVKGKVKLMELYYFNDGEIVEADAELGVVETLQVIDEMVGYSLYVEYAEVK